MDIHAGFLAAALLALLAAFLTARSGIRGIQAARKMTFYRLRKQRMAGGWRLFIFGLILLALAYWLPFRGEAIAYRYFPPSPTVTVTPTITLTTTITLTPTITWTPSLTDTPSTTDTATITPTPFLPAAIEALFDTQAVSPDPRVFFSLEFTTAGNSFPTIDPATVFQNPVGHMYAIFSYTDMVVGSQWTALWLREGQLVHYETFPWTCDACSTGGSGYTDWDPAPDEWIPGNYEVQIFSGKVWAGSGRFIVQGAAPTAIASHTPTPTVTPTFTRTPTLTPTFTRTPLPTLTRTPTKTSTP